MVQVSESLNFPTQIGSGRFYQATDDVFITIRLDEGNVRLAAFGRVHVAYQSTLELAHGEILADAGPLHLN